MATTLITGMHEPRIDRMQPLTPPDLLHRELPIDEVRRTAVTDARTSVAAVLDGHDDRLLVIVGPCSVHDPLAALDYATRLSGLAGTLGDDLLVLMRVYFEKPRTVVGWKGLIYDPRLDGSGDIDLGLRTARALLLRVLDLGLPVACEFLDPLLARYTSDTVAWGAIGARTVESQIHRQLASGLPMPIGMKNRPDGSVTTAVDAVLAAGAPHVHAGTDTTGQPVIAHTTGNTDCHLVLRGGSRSGPNFGPVAVEDALRRLRSADLPERVVIDASHDNSGKDHQRQAGVVGEVARQVESGQRGIVGLMLESFLVAGRQDIVPGRPLTYGQSVTDACLSWEATVATLDRLALAARRRRGTRPAGAGHAVLGARHA
ncbi:phospho-2-dehydro-3-deoxyheptonate aldolase [Longispora fulva]|uniref:Phospho-2-dehydro-3-deoxyheptonate aldolase n=1 Tax=Longispora fulva TaxID=619741 RepID=A0A8J7KJW4_9ACTN|nr:3-deoxy-7-phosphoheptulonate synthase [Longispora fulva]MBG6135951.1 3-deoxy-7-phosphoheptulonate synthase [Longispora fulva]GIG55805.1 phospho-2-dehydro-3-deoxyheptonate aldolase [Longispora fulva]